MQEVSKKVDYVFTAGGIGPTHDDITAESIAGLGVPLELNEEAYRNSGPPLRQQARGNPTT